LGLDWSLGVDEPCLVEINATAITGHARLYRVEGSSASGILYVYGYRVAKTTRCGCWVVKHGLKQRFVLDGARKRFAYPTVDEALVSFIARKKAQVRILSNKHDTAKMQLSVARQIIEQRAREAA
jgi:hypothetical protein